MRFFGLILMISMAVSCRSSASSSASGDVQLADATVQEHFGGKLGAGSTEVYTFDFDFNRKKPVAFKSVWIKGVPYQLVEEVVPASEAARSKNMNRLRLVARVHKPETQQTGQRQSNNEEEEIEEQEEPVAVPEGLPSATVVVEYEAHGKKHFFPVKELHRLERVYYP